MVKDALVSALKNQTDRLAALFVIYLEVLAHLQQNLLSDLGSRTRD